MNRSRERTYGLILPVIHPEDYVQGGRIQLAGEALVPNGQWDSFLPEDELQAHWVETQACATFGTLNCVEALERRVYGAAHDWSDRWLAKLSGTTKQGNDPHQVAETLRKKGCVNQLDWPYDKYINTWELFYQDIPFEMEVQGQVQFRGSYDFGHQYVRTDPESMMQALCASPLGVDVDAWHKKGDVYVRKGASNHWVMIYGYKKGKYWKILDTYDNTKKRLAWGYSFSIAKQYTLDKRVLGETLWDKAIKFLRSFWV